MFLPDLAVVRTLVVALVTLLAPPPAPGSELDVSLVGAVTDAETGAPIGGAQLMIEARSVGTLSNRAGRYLLELGGSWTGRDVAVTAHAVGYGSTTGTVVVGDGANTLDFALSPVALAKDEAPLDGETGPVRPTARDATPRHAVAISDRRASAADEPGSDVEAYAPSSENAFVAVRGSPVSTFGIEVDRSSYSNVRRFIHDGVRPPIDAVRIEELINYFSFSDPAPQGDAPLSVTTEVAPAPWQPLHHVVRIGLKARSIDMSDAPANNLVFLLDLSPSMSAPDKLPLLKSAFGLLVDKLRPEDRVAIVVYGGPAGLVLPPTAGTDKGRILDALERLQRGGSTARGTGMRLAYDVAADHHVQGGNNRVILATDGDFDLGLSSEYETTRLIQEQSERGTLLTVLGFGDGDPRQVTVEGTVDRGLDRFVHIAGPLDAKKVLVEEIGGRLVTIAQDVRVQVEFNPARVAAYRLIGYENGSLVDDGVPDDHDEPAGELGAGHSVTALYEIVPVGVDSRADVRGLDPLRYQTVVPSAGASASSELMFVKLRYQEPGGSATHLVARAVESVATRASDDLRFAAAVAGWGMLLRDSEHCEGFTLDEVARLARSALGPDPDGQRAEFLRLVDRTRSLELLAMTPGARQ